MKLGMFLLVPLCVSCGGATQPFDNPSDAGVNADTKPALELVCAENFCGNLVDKNTGAAANCGSCASTEQCGDNGVANVCGSACMPLVEASHIVTPACDLAFGFGWATGYGTPVQIPAQCGFTNPLTCMEIDNQVLRGKPCAGTVCGPWICCADNLDAGTPALLPGSIANSDGGLP